jgi:hypothetical protein
MKADNSHSTDTAGNSHMGNTRHNNRDTHNSREIRTLFRPKRQRQNAARERKPVPRLPIQLREAFSLFYLPLIKQELKGKVFHFIRMEESRDTP